MVKNYFLPFFLVPILLITAFFNRAWAVPDVESNKLLYINFNGTIQDSGPKHYPTSPGCVMDPVVTYVGGIEGSAFSADGVSNDPCVMVGGARAGLVDLQGMDQLTIAIWVKKLSPNSAGILLIKQDLNASPYSLRLAARGFSASVYTNQNITVTADVNNEDTQWHHYAMTYDSHQIRLYFDGVQVAAGPQTGVVLPPSDVSASLLTGRCSLQAPVFTGVMDEVRVYNRALTAADLLKLSTVKLPPTARFSVSASSGVVPLTVVFDASASEPGSNSIVDYAWDFSDRSPLHGPIQTRVYSSTGVYTATCTVTNDLGRTSQGGTIVYSLPTPTPHYLLGLNFDQNYFDWSGSNHPTSVGCSSARNLTFTPGVEGSAMLLDGPCLAIGLSRAGIADLQGMAQLTLTAWAKKMASSSAGEILVKRDLRNDAYSLRILPGGFSTDIYTDRALTLKADINNADTRWHHYAVTYDSSLVRLYFDGRLVASAPLTGPVLANLDGQSADLNVGRLMLDPFAGAIDDLRIYDEALSGDVIREMATSVSIPIHNNGGASSGPSDNGYFNSFKNIFQPNNGEALEISFGLKQSATVSLLAYDIKGNPVRTILNESRDAAPAIKVSWDGKNSAGSLVASGVYILELKSAGGIVTTKVVVVK